MEPKDKLKEQLTAIADVLELGADHLLTFQKAALKNYGQYIKIIEDDHRPHVTNLDLMGMQLRIRVEAQYLQGEIKSWLGVYAISADKKKETELTKYFYEFGDKLNVLVDRHSAGTEHLPRLLLEFLLAKLGMVFRPDL